MFGSLGVPELLLIFAVILIVFGPRRIPEIGRTLGKALSEFRKATDDIKSTIEREVRLEELKQIAPTVVTPFESISRSEPFNPANPDPAETDSTIEPIAPIAPDAAVVDYVARFETSTSDPEPEPATPRTAE